jgi:hypothetical protein
LKEKTTWLEENPEAEAEDYEDQLSELQSTVGVSFPYRIHQSILINSQSPPCFTAVVEMTRFLSATMSFKPFMRGVIRGKFGASSEES